MLIQILGSTHSQQMYVTVALIQGPIIESLLQLPPPQKPYPSAFASHCLVLGNVVWVILPAGSTYYGIPNVIKHPTTAR
jgi:hypothetical protein